MGTTSLANNYTKRSPYICRYGNTIHAQMLFHDQLYCNTIAPDFKNAISIGNTFSRCNTIAIQYNINALPIHWGGQYIFTRHCSWWLQAEQARGVSLGSSEMIVWQECGQKRPRRI
jgi:hypothetical protein